MSSEAMSRIQKYTESYVSDVKRKNPCIVPCIYVWQLREVGYSDKQILSLRQIGWEFTSPNHLDVSNPTWWNANFDKCIRLPTGQIAYSLQKMWTPTPDTKITLEPEFEDIFFN